MPRPARAHLRCVLVFGPKLEGDENDTATAPTRWPLADGRDLLFFALPGHTPAPVTDRRPLPAREHHQSQLRFDRQTGQWVTIAARRQDRTYKPAADSCPLCPDPSGLTSEVPAARLRRRRLREPLPEFRRCGTDAAFHLPSPTDDRLRLRARPRPLRGHLLLQQPRRVVRRPRAPPRATRRRRMAPPNRRPDGAGPGSSRCSVSRTAARRSA